MASHIHVFPVDPSLTADEAWDELCLMHVRATNTGEAKWATIHCDGQECSDIADETVTPRRKRMMPPTQRTSPWQQIRPHLEDTWHDFGPAVLVFMFLLLALFG